MIIDEFDQEVPMARVAMDSLNLVRSLRARGMTPADRVVLSAGNGYEFVPAIFALMELGVSIGLVDRRLPEAECAALVADCGARWFLSDHDQLGPAYDRVKVNWIRLGELAASGGGAEAEGDLTFQRWIDRSDALIVWTSGSTGTPKGIVRSGSSVLNNVARTQARMNYTGSDVFLPLLPFTHQYGLSMLLLWWSSGGSLSILPSSRIDLALETISRRAVTVVDAVPAAYRALLRLLDGRGGDGPALDSVRMWCVGGEPLRDDLRDRFAARMGRPLLDGYGSSEAGNIALASLANPYHCGRPLDGITVEILGEDGRPVPAGDHGEVVVRTPDIMIGILEPGGSVRRVDRSVYHTNDIGFMDAHGDLRVLGRKSAVYRLGHTLYPDAIAGKVSACGTPMKVVPVEDGKRGTQLVYIVGDPADRPASHWRRIIRKFVAEHELPNRIVVLAEFPLNNTGKIDLQALRDIAASAVALEGVKGVLPVTRIETDALQDQAPPIPFADRLPRLKAVAELLRNRRTEVMEILTEVCHHKTAYGEIDASIAALEGSADEIARYAPPRIDQVGVLMPSNIPLYSYILYLMVPSLYGRRVVFRPSRRIEDQTRKLHELLSGVHGLPVVLDESDQREFLQGAGATSDVLVFTGTYNNAEQIRKKLRSDQLFLYFGQGVNPFVVGPEASIPRAVDGLIRVRMLNSGQDCFGPDVVFVHTSISARFCNLLCRRLAALRHGPLDDPAADYGSMFYLDAFDDSIEYLRKNREFLSSGGEVNLVDNHLSPTVLIHPSDTETTPPELFAPIFNIVPFGSTDWLHQMLRHPYFEERAMAATVFGGLSDTVELLRRRHSVSVNETLIEIENGNAPFGGRGIRANYAALGKKRHAEPLLVSKAVADHLSPARKSGSTA